MAEAMNMEIKGKVYRTVVRLALVHRAAGLQGGYMCSEEGIERDWRSQKCEYCDVLRKLDRIESERIRGQQK